MTEEILRIEPKHSLIFGPIDEPSEYEKTMATTLVENYPQFLFAVLNKILNERGLCLSISSLDDVIWHKEELKGGDKMEPSLFTKEEIMDENWLEWKTYKRRGEIKARYYKDGEDLTNVSVSEEDSPRAGGMIAKSPDNENDQWYINPEYFNKHYIEKRN